MLRNSAQIVVFSALLLSLTCVPARAATCGQATWTITAEIR